MTKSTLRREWLIGNSILAYMGALLLVQSWGPSGGTYRLPGDVAPPIYPDPTVLALASFLFVTSLTLGILAAIPKLRDTAIRLVTPIGPVLAVLAWLIFTGSWLGIIGELPGGVWWAHVLAWGGVPMFLYLFAKLFYELLRGGMAPPAGRTPRRPAEGE